ncbi:MarR family transcriptional regulator [Tardiphaga alba]|uniref:MarR family transcriptional regulator n=1 Tax=Tardiphaga alba TaxID=340268 RepID=A0ABX8A5A1_9BRAD|nr:helix-turn-helix domain-containing GNAT family N-acetyltransferase [Tardiphaga alba]QUS38407.1 MarR family transcriptional regulator [Tardiphaga alba]
MSQAPDPVAAVRAFNRFYTRHLGVLDQQLLESPYSLTEARVLYELASKDGQSAKEIGSALKLDAGYLSRILQAFDAKGLVVRKPSPADRRQYRLSLTAKGRLAFGRLNRGSHDQVTNMLDALGTHAPRVVQAMATIEALLGESEAAQATLRSPRPGDMGWVVQSHGALYASEYGYDASFEGLVADIVAKYIAAFNPSRERCWIAEMNGAPVGSIFLVKASDDIAKIRLLIIDPVARGQNLGHRLTAEAISFARQCGYRKITLWTQSNLFAARKIYERAGFALVASEPHRSFGQNLVGETWELVL